MSGREWKPFAWTIGLDATEIIKAGDTIRVTIEGRVSEVFGHGVDFTNGAGKSHTVYLNQDDVRLELLAPPKPDEPQGLGAVVEDADGRTWVRCSQEDEPWRSDDDNGNGVWNYWDHITAAHVLSEGVVA